MTDADSPPPPLPRASLAIAAVSAVVEWYDFTLYLYMATVLSRVFFGPGPASIGATLGAFAIAYLMRPLGAAAFGRLGDRRGRRHAMLASMAVMAAALLATGLMPTRAQAGPLAGALLLLLRCAMGFSVGGEYNGVVTYLLEGAPRGRRGLLAACAAAASEVGALLAAGVAALTVSALSPADLDAWGWRIPFLVGAALAGGVWLARVAMRESPEFERQRAAGVIPDAPLRQVAGRHRAGVARAFAISALGSITYYVGITYVPVFLTSVGALDEGQALRLSTVAAVAVILVTPATGLLADRFGRRPVLAALALLSAAAPVSMFALMASPTASSAPMAPLIGAVVLAAVAGGVSAVGAAATAEQFPGEGRMSGLALGATAATALFGGLAPYLAHLLTARTGLAIMPGVMIAAVALAVLPVFLAMPETAPRTGAD